MDPKQSAPLDPKLQQAYDKVMGVSLDTPTNGSSAPQATPSPTPTPSDPILPATPGAVVPPQMPADPMANPSPALPTTPVAPIDPVGSQPSPAIPQIPTIDVTMPTPSPVPTPEPSIPTMPSITPQEEKPVLSSQEVTPGPVASTMENTVSMKPHAFVAKSGGKMKISPVILAIGAIAFLLVYTVIWIKVFNIPVPYINQ